MLLKNKHLTDVIHKEITFDDENRWMYDLFTTYEFQRLSRIRQLGTSYRTFPCATHTRLAHSLGVYELTNKFVKQLISLGIDNKEFKPLLCAALLHDLGHGPNSHSFEAYTGINHEVYTKRIILDPKTQINQVLRKNGVKPIDVVNVLEGKSKTPWISAIIESQLDTDRMDYLLRDSFHTGAAYGHITISMILNSLRVIDDKVCFLKKALEEIENMLIGRYHMHVDICNNKNGIAYETVLKLMFERIKELYKQGYKFVDRFNLLSTIKPWLDNKEFSVQEFLKLDDNIFESLVASLSYETDFYIKGLLRAFNNHDYFVVKEIDGKTAENIKVKTSEKYEKVIASSARIKIYKTNVQPIYIYDEKNGKISELSKISPVISKLKTLEHVKYYQISIKLK